MKYKKFETLMKSEIKKAEAAANKFYGRTDCKVTGYSSKPSEVNGFQDVLCEICFNYEERADHDVFIAVCLWDRRRSFADIW